MAPDGNTTTLVLVESLDIIAASARSRREYDAVIPQLVDNVTLDANSGTSWREILFEQLNAQAVDEEWLLFFEHDPEFPLGRLSQENGKYALACEPWGESQG